MEKPQYFSLVIAPSRMHVHGAVWAKHIFCGLFIILVALLCTQRPGTLAASVWDQDTIDINDVEPCYFDCHLGLSGQ